MSETNNLNYFINSKVFPHNFYQNNTIFSSNYNSPHFFPPNIPTIPTNNPNPFNSTVLNTWLKNQNNSNIKVNNDQNKIFNIFSLVESDSDNSENNSDKKLKSIETMDFKTKWKTEKCHYWEMHGECKFGENCAFAHGDKELKLKINNNISYKTKPCKQFFEDGYCNYGIRCQFSHKESVYESYHNIKPKTKYRNNPIIYTKIISNLLEKGHVGLNVVKRPRLLVFENILACSVNDVIKNRLLFYQDVLDINFFLKRTNFKENVNIF